MSYAHHTDGGSTLTINLGPHERVILDYFADQFRRSKGAVVREIIKNYVRAYRNFDARGFKKFVETKYAPSENMPAYESKILRDAAEKVAWAWRSEHETTM